jgi:hypothetical protein
MSTTPRTLHRPVVAAPINTGRVAVVTAAALALNLIALWIGGASGASLETNAPEPINALTVTITTLVVLIGGSTALGPISRRWSNVRNWAPTAGLAVGAVTMVMPFFAADDAKTGATLAAMHLITGLAWFGALRPSKAE